MADNRVQQGFRPVMTLDGSAVPHPIAKNVASGYQGNEAGQNIDLCIGDPVRLLASGYVEHAGAGDDIWGVVVGIKPYWNGFKKVFGDRLPGNTVWGSIWDRRSQVLVVPAAGVIFEADCDDAVTATTEAAYAAFVGENVDHVFAGASTAPLGFPRLDISTHVATTAQWRIHDVSKTLNNQDFSGLYVKLLVTVNETQQAPFVTAGI